MENILNESKEVELFDGDTINIFQIEKFNKNYVEILSSSVMRSGKYELTPDMKILDLVNKSDGLISNAYLYKANIIRIKDDLTYETISVDLNEVMSGNKVVLEASDKLQMQSDTASSLDTIVSLLEIT